MTIEELFRAARPASNLASFDLRGLDLALVRRVAMSQHGMFPLVARSILAQRDHPLDESEREVWVAEVRRYSLYGLQAVAVLRSILVKLQEAGIRAVSWKGPIQSWRLYGDPSLRQFTDLDICVQSHEVLRAAEVLRGLGFQPERRLSREGERRLLRFDSEYPWHREDGSVVDLQWRVRAQPLWLDPEKTGAWERTISFSEAGYDYRVWGWADELIFLALHGAKHRWLAWEWVLSFARTADRCSEEDWAIVQRLSQQWGLARIIDLGLLVAELLVGRSPSWAWRGCIHEEVNAMAQGIIARVRRSLEGGVMIPNRTSWRDYILLSESKWVGWAQVAGWLVRPSVYDLQAFPSYPSPLLYLLRPWRLGRKLLR